MDPPTVAGRRATVRRRDCHHEERTCRNVMWHAATRHSAAIDIHSGNTARSRSPSCRSRRREAGQRSPTNPPTPPRGSGSSALPARPWPHRSGCPQRNSTMRPPTPRPRHAAVELHGAPAPNRRNHAGPVRRTRTAKSSAPSRSPPPRMLCQTPTWHSSISRAPQIWAQHFTARRG